MAPTLAVSDRDCKRNPRTVDRLAHGLARDQFNNSVWLKCILFLAIRPELEVPEPRTESDFLSPD